jgi:hypothetical protein
MCVASRIKTRPISRCLNLCDVVRLTFRAQDSHDDLAFAHRKDLRQARSLMSVHVMGIAHATSSRYEGLQSMYAKKLPLPSEAILYDCTKWSETTCPFSPQDFIARFMTVLLKLRHSVYP